MCTTDPRRSRPRPHLRLRHHRLRRRTVGTPLDHHRHLPSRARAGARPHHGRSLSFLPSRRQQGQRSARRKAEVIWHSVPTRIPPHPQRHSSGLRLRACTPHHAPVHRSQRRDRRDLDEVPGNARTTARPAQRSPAPSVGRMGDPARGSRSGVQRQMARGSQKAARRVVAAAHRTAEGNRRLHRRQGRVRVSLRQAIRGQAQGSRGRSVHGGESVAASCVGRR